MLGAHGDVKSGSHNIGDRSGGSVPSKFTGLGGAQGGMLIFEPWPHTTCAHLRNQTMASQKTLDTWPPAAKKEKTAGDRR